MPGETTDAEPISIKERCIFCQIASGKISTKTVYSDNDVMAILDINPANPGHMLLLTREHYQIMPQIPDAIIGHLLNVAKKLSQISLRSLKTTGTTILVANGAIAGQRAPHFMMHIIPRVEGDNIGFAMPLAKLEESESKKIYAVLKERVNKLFGMETEVSIAKAEKETEPEEEKADLDKIAEILLKKGGKDA